MTERRCDIDWLRVLAMLAVFVFHCTRFFDTEGWHLKNAEQSFVLFILVRGLMWPWLMEIFFLLSGAGAWYVLQSRSAGAFVADRAKRLLIPLYTVGFLILLPPQFYFQRVIMDSSVGGALRRWLPAYLRRFRPAAPLPLAEYSSPASIRRALVVSEIPLSHFARRASAPRLSEIAAGSAPDRRARRMVRAPGRDLRVRDSPRACVRRSQGGFPGAKGVGRVRLVRDLLRAWVLDPRRRPLHRGLQEAPVDRARPVDRGHVRRNTGARARHSGSTRCRGRNRSLSSLSFSRSSGASRASGRSFSCWVSARAI